MNYYRCGGGGGRLEISSNWFGTPAEYAALSSKTKDTLYKTFYDSIVPSAEYIGETQICPANMNFSDYYFLMSYFSPSGYQYETGFQWLNNDFELSFSLKLSSYSGTNVLISTNTSTNQHFNIICNGTNLRLFDSGHNQTIIDTIQAGAIYKIKKIGTTISIYRDSTELISYTLNYSGNDTLRLFAWNNSYNFSGPIRFLSIKIIT